MGCFGPGEGRGAGRARLPNDLKGFAEEFQAVQKCRERRQCARRAFPWCARLLRKLRCVDPVKGS